MLNTFSRFAVLSVLMGSLFVFGCSSSDPEISGSCTGVVDTLVSDEIVIHNIDDPLWGPGEGWEIVEEMRFGSGTGDDPIFFGSIRSFDVDRHGNLFILDAQTQETYILDSVGVLIRTVGARGTGPGEFEEASAVDVSENGEIWIMEMRKGQLTVLDAEGNYQRVERVNTVGWTVVPYSGGFDQVGRYNALIRCYNGVESRRMFARFDQSFAPIDTIAIPESPVEGDFFEYDIPDGGSIRASIPYQGAFGWVFSAHGNLWTLATTSTKTYELVETTSGGRILRRVTKELEPIPVTSADRVQARENLRWFTNQGGTIDLNRIPGHKPVVRQFFSDDDGNLWVMRTTITSEEEGTLFDVFDAEGDFLGEVRFPFALEINPGPIVRDDLLYGITQSEDGGAVIVRAQIQKTP